MPAIGYSSTRKRRRRERIHERNNQKALQNCLINIMVDIMIDAIKDTEVSVAEFTDFPEEKLLSLFQKKLSTEKVAQLSLDFQILKNIFAPILGEEQFETITEHPEFLYQMTRWMVARANIEEFNRRAK